MSQIMFTAALAVRSGTRLDWAAGESAIDTLPQQAAEEAAEVIGEGGDGRQRLHEAARRARLAVGGRNRECTALAFGEWMLYVSGGWGNGDPPTDFYTDAFLLEHCGIAAAIGFSWPIPATEQPTSARGLR